MQRTWKPIVGGILAIVSGAVNLLVALALGTYAYVPSGQMGITAMLLNVGIVAVLLIVVGILAIAGGIFALLRRHWGLALAGSICAIVFPGMLLGIAATVLVALSRGEFGRTPTVS